MRARGGNHGPRDILPRRRPHCLLTCLLTTLVLSPGGISQIPEGPIPRLGVWGGGHRGWGALPRHPRLRHLQAHQELLPEARGPPGAGQLSVHSLRQWGPEVLSGPARGTWQRVLREGQGCTHVYPCEYEHVCTCMCIYSVGVHTHILHMCEPTCMLYLWLCAYVCMCLHVCMYTRVCVFMCAHM